MSSCILGALIQAERERQQRQGAPRLQDLCRPPPPPLASGRPWLLPAGLAGAGLGLLAALLWGSGTSGAAAPVALAAATLPEAAPEKPVGTGTAPPPLACPPAPPPGPAAAAVGRRARAARLGKNAAPRLYRVAQLPAALRATAQGLAVAGYARTGERDQRMAIVNDRAVREGDWLAAGLRIERIGGDGVVFNLKGYRFLKGRS